MRPALTKLRLASKDDNEPLYDSVAPDDDYASIEENQALFKEDRKDGKAASSGTEVIGKLCILTVRMYAQHNYTWYLSVCWLVSLCMAVYWAKCMLMHEVKVKLIGIVG